MLISEIERRFDLASCVSRKSIDSFVSKKTIDDLMLGAPRYLDLIDIYMDYEDGALIRNSHYLRIRVKDKNHFITLRFSLELQQQVVIDEITHRLNDAGLKLILSKLKSLIYVRKEPNYNLPFFKEILHDMGLIEAVCIHTKRVARNVMLENTRICQIRLDQFNYFLNQKKIREDDFHRFEFVYYRDQHSVLVEKTIAKILTIFNEKYKEVDYGKVGLFMRL